MCLFYFSELTCIQHLNLAELPSPSGKSRKLDGKHLEVNSFDSISDRYRPGSSRRIYRGFEDRPDMPNSPTLPGATAPYSPNASAFYRPRDLSMAESLLMSTRTLTLIRSVQSSSRCRQIPARRNIQATPSTSCYSCRASRASTIRSVNRICIMAGGVMIQGRHKGLQTKARTRASRVDRHS
jgi:hypothetical protein